MSTRLKLPAAIVAAVLVAEAAVLLLRPERELEPLPVAESSYFSAAQLERARDFAGGQRLLGIGSLICQGVALTILVVRPPRRLVGLASLTSRGRALVAVAIVGAALMIVLQGARLPFAAVAHDRAVDFGLSTQSWPGWAWDVARSAAIATLLAAAGAVVFAALMRRFPRSWWLGGAGVTVATAVLFVWLAPVVLDPIFNRYTELSRGATRSDVIELAQRAGVDVGDVFVVDASRRTRTANAYVTGLGHTKRVVLFDTLLRRFTREQTRLVVAHELAHVKHRDVPRGLLWVAIVALPGMYVVMLLTHRWSARAGAKPGSAASLPALALALVLVALGGTIISNQLSRRVEADADAFSLRITNKPRDFIGLERRLALANLSDPEPPALVSWLFRTHPTTMQRIGAGLAFQRKHAGRR